MFVFKAAVVGAGTMGGEIAQVIAAADIPVVLKDVDQKFVDAGLAKAREVTEKQVGKLVAKEKITEEQGRAQVDAHARADHRHDLLRRLRRRRLRDRGRPRADGGQARGVLRARRRHARPRGARLQHERRCRSPRSATPPTAPDKVVGFHFFWPASVMRLVEVIEGEDTSPGHDPGGEQLRAGDPQDRRALRRVPRLRRQPDPHLGGLGGLARPGRDGRRSSELDAHLAEAASMPMGPFRVVDMSGLDTVVKVARDMRRRLRRPLLRPPGHGEARRRGQARRQVGGRASMST